MIIIKPDYYDHFVCLGGQCPNTCCGNWEIGIDEDSLTRYASLKGDFGREVRNSVDWMEECFLQDDYRCRLLTEEGLCGLQAHFGEKYLCETCRTYPRHVEEFEGRREYTLAVSCPEAARLVLEKGLGKILMEETSEEDPYEYEDFDQAYFAQLLKLREQLVFTGKEPSDSVHKESVNVTVQSAPRICSEVREIEQLSPEKSEIEQLSIKEPETKHLPHIRIPAISRDYEKRKRLMEYLLTFEEIDHRWKSHLRKTISHLYGDGKEAYERNVSCYPVNARWLQNLQDYFVWVYLPGAIYDGDAEGKLRMAAFFTAVMEEMLTAEQCGTGEEDLKKAALIVSRVAREMEHSDRNLERMENEICLRK